MKAKKPVKCVHEQEHLDVGFGSSVLKFKMGKAENINL